MTDDLERRVAEALEIHAASGSEPLYVVIAAALRAVLAAAAEYDWDDGWKRGCGNLATAGDDCLAAGLAALEGK